MAQAKSLSTIGQLLEVGQARRLDDQEAPGTLSLCINAEGSSEK
jgi:hypothetical protein